MNVAYFVVQQTMYFAIPLLIVAIGAMYSERSGVINIALEGIMVMGAFAGIFFINIFQGTLSGQGLFLLAMLVAGLTGGLFSLLHAFASINMKADQTISGTALNLFAPAFAIFTARMIQGMQQIQFTDTFHINKVPVLGDIPVIGDVIAIVIVRGLVNRGEPEYVDTELFQIRQVLRDAVQIADPVSVAVCKAAWINLINDGLFPPGLCFISNLHHSYLHSRLPRQPLILLSCVCYSIISSYSIIPKERKIYLKFDSKLLYFYFFE